MNINEKEYGGYLPLELPINKEFYTGTEVLALNSGRYSILEAIRQGNFSKVYVPLYMCQSVIDALENMGIVYEFYHIDEAFMPINISVQDKEVLIYTNYFGINSYEKNLKIYEKYSNVIYDNTQAFFSKPILEAYNVYSCRKFIGVSDGAYLIHKNIKNIDVETDLSYARASFLLKSIELGTNSAYNENLDNEISLESVGIKSMSKLTHRILQSVDYDKVIAVRRNNFNVLHSALGEINTLDLSKYDGVPMIYPLLTERIDRKYLVEHKIYVPQWWKWILEHEPNSWEQYLVNHLLPLPVDQRYCESDMKNIANIVLSGINIF